MMTQPCSFADCNLWGHQAFHKPMTIGSTMDRVKAMLAEAEDKLFTAKTHWELGDCTKTIRELHAMLKELKTL